MIDENKLIEDLIPLLNKYGDMYLAGRILGMIDCQPKTDWIPCEERLPSENGLYLATFECEDEIVVDIMFMIGKQFYYPEDAIGNFGRSVEVIAWQPLPQPYKKEGAE